ncbi:hypothetical protein BH11PAT4_BH11PAT4_2560 [soil metagenome]
MAEEFRYYIDNNSWTQPVEGTITSAMLDLIRMIRESDRGEVVLVSTGTPDQLAAIRTLMERIDQPWARDIMGPMDNMLWLSNLGELEATPILRHDHFITGRSILRDSKDFPEGFSGALYTMDTTCIEGFGCCAIQLMLTCAPIPDGLVDHHCPITAIGRFKGDVISAQVTLEELRI